MAGVVIPFPGVTLPEETARVAALEAKLDDLERRADAITTARSRKPAPTPPCVVCGSTVEWDSFAQCERCKAEMHEVCYYGRVAAMEKWLAYLQWRDDGAAFEASTPGPSRLCVACRTGDA